VVKKSIWRLRLTAEDESTNATQQPHAVAVKAREMVGIFSRFVCPSFTCSSVEECSQEVLRCLYERRKGLELRVFVRVERPV